LFIFQGEYYGAKYYNDNPHQLTGTDRYIHKRVYIYSSPRVYISGVYDPRRSAQNLGAFEG
jgi:hypothetical protein